MLIQRILIFISLVFISINCDSQELLLKDLDHDNIKDHIIFDQENGQIICKLSTQNYQEIRSMILEDLNDNSGIELTKNGFQFYNHSMRLGYYCQFRFDATENNIQLIGISRYNLGDAFRSGSGESSVNLLTNKYIGEWNRFDQKNKKLVKVPTIKRSYSIKKVFLEDFSVKQADDFVDFCDQLRNTIVY